MRNKFYRVNESGALYGVCGGLAYYMGIQTWIVRMIVFVLSITAIVPFGLILFLYFTIAAFAPKFENDPDDYKETCE